MISRLVHRIQQFFEVSRKEARAALVLMVLTFILLWTPFIFRRLVLPHFSVTAPKFDNAKLDSLAAQIAKTTEISEYQPTHKNESETVPPHVTVRLFRFDPNEISTTEFRELGVPDFLTKRIDKYRSKGGKFRRKEDLLRIYDFPADLYKKLEPYIFLNESIAVTSRLPTSATSKSETPQSVTSIRENRFLARSALVPFDINTADTTQLIKLKGIGSKLSARILKFRDALGGFHSSAQFEEIYGLDTLALAELQKYARVTASPKKIDINTASIVELGTHPYLRNKRVVQVIVNYRDQHGPYGSVEDLKRTKVLDDATISKIAPYLSF
jgi:competence protein ComEA